MKNAFDGLIILDPAEKKKKKSLISQQKPPKWRSQEKKILIKTEQSI